MKITAIIPAYNAGKYIKRCLDSLVGKVDEIIVINDGSKDNTLDILKMYNGITIYNNDNHGASYSRNFGIEKSTNEYIMFVDADDYLSDDFDKIVSSIKFNGEDVIYLNKSIQPNSTKEVIIKHIIGYREPCIAGPYCKLYRKNFIRDNNIRFKEELINGEDMLFNIECALKMKKYSIINKSIYMYRVALSSATKKFDSRVIESDRSFHEHINKILTTKTCRDTQELLNYCKVNAIITIVDRLSYLQTYLEFKNKIAFLNEEPYNNFVNASVSNLSKKRKILLNLIKTKHYKILYYILKSNHKRYKNKKEKFLEI